MADEDWEPVGAAEIAERLGVRLRTVTQWKWRGLMPEPRMTVGINPLWDWGTVERWAKETGRL